MCDLNNIVGEIKKRQIKDIGWIPVTNTLRDIIVAHNNSTIMEAPLIERCFVDGKTRVECDLNADSVRSAIQSVFTKRSNLGEARRDNAVVVLLLFDNPADAESEKIREIANVVSAEIPNGGGTVEICIARPGEGDLNVPESVRRVWLLKDAEMNEKTAAFELVLLLKLYVENDGVRNARFFSVDNGRTFSALEHGLARHTCERIDKLLGTTTGDDGRTELLNKCCSEIEQRMETLKCSFFGAVPHELTLLPRYARLRRGASTKKVYGEYKGKAVCNIFLGKIIKEAESFFNTELDDAFFGELPLCMFDDMRMKADFVQKLKEKILNDVSDAELPGDAMDCGKEWDKILKNGFRKRFVNTIEHGLETRFDAARIKRGILTECKTVVSANFPGADRITGFGGARSNTAKPNWNRLSCDVMLAGGERGAGFPSEDCRQIYLTVFPIEEHGTGRDYHYLFGDEDIVREIVTNSGPRAREEFENAQKPSAVQINRDHLRHIAVRSDGMPRSLLVSGRILVENR